MDVAVRANIKMGYILLISAIINNIHVNNFYLFEICKEFSFFLTRSKFSVHFV